MAPLLLIIDGGAQLHRAYAHNRVGGELMRGQNVADPGDCFDIPRLLQLFESLGDNCDLGVVQRAVGIEPFGLFRFAACKAPDVAVLLRERFQPLGEPEDLWLEEVGPLREYRVKSRRYSFESHTDRYAGKDDPDVARAAQMEKIGFLKARLIGDCSRARKLFVIKGTADGVTVREIAAQLKTYGPNSLLWVRLAGPKHQAAAVERIADNLLAGYVSHFGTYDGDPNLPVEEWVEVCANAYRLWRDADPPKARVDNLLLHAEAKNTCQWIAYPPGATRVVDVPVFHGERALEHRVGSAEAASVYRAYLPIASGGSFVLSAWVRIPRGFRGRQIALLFSGYSSIAMWTADLKSPARWQRIWVTANLPVDAPDISCDMLAEGSIGDVFHSASWCLERGTRPLGYGFAL
jgi:hypothetical protein